jgi:hypothetical protein
MWSLSVLGEFHDQGDNVEKEYYLLIVIQTTKYALRATNPWPTLG